MEEESFVDFRRARQNGRIRRYSREELLAIGRKPGLTGLPQGVNMSVIRELEELTFFDSGPKPDWNKEKPPGYGRLDFLRPGGSFGGPIRSRLVADGSLPDELPPARSVDLLGPSHSMDGSLDIRRSSSWRPGAPEGGSGHTPPDRWTGPTTPGRRLGEDTAPRRGTRWDEAKSGTTPERDSWRSGVPPSPSNADERWRPGGGPAGPPGARPPPNRWGDDDRPRGAGWGPRGSLDEREAPRRPPPGMGHDDKWGGPRGPPGWEGHEGRGEWAGRRDMAGGGGHWERDPAWMHDGQEAGGPVTAGRTLMPPPPSRAGMTAKDIEKERQEMQAQWRAEAAANKAKQEDDMAFLRSDSDDEQQQPPPPPAPPARTGSGPASHQGSLTMQEHGGSHPARSRFFDVSSGDGGGHPHHPQPGTPSAAAAEVVGKKLTFDQFKQAAAAGGAASPSLGPPTGALEQPPPPPPVPSGSKVLTIAELEHQMSGGPLPPPPPAPGGTGESRVADREASKKLMAFLKKPAPPPGAGLGAAGAAASLAQQQPAPPAAQQQQRPAQPSPPAASARAPGPGLALFPPPGLLHLGLEDDSTAGTGLAAKLAGLAKGSADTMGSAFGSKTEASALSPTLGGFESMLGGTGKVPAALAGIWGTGLGVWDHAPKSTGSGLSLVPPLGGAAFASAAAASPGGGGGGGGGLKPASGPGSGALNPVGASSAAGMASNNPLAALLASAAAGAPGMTGGVGAHAMGLPNGATAFGNQAALHAANLARSAGVGVAGAAMPAGSQFLPNTQLPAAYGSMAGQRPAAAQAGFRLGAVDQQAQLRQLLSQAQQRVPGMP
eukprot:gene5104-5344_t